MEFTNIEKRIVLEKKNIEPQVGACMPYGCPEECQNVFIDKKEFLKVIDSGFKIYYYSESREAMLDLDEMFEEVLDEIIDNECEDYNDENIEHHIKEKYLNKQ